VKIFAKCCTIPQILADSLEDNIKVGLKEIRLAGCGLDSSRSGQGQVTGCCEHGDETSGFIKCDKYLD
jgi:hypothetical protein